jgi:hypothetical protein
MEEGFQDVTEAFQFEDWLADFLEDDAEMLFMLNIRRSGGWNALASEARRCVTHARQVRASTWFLVWPYVMPRTVSQCGCAMQ